MGIGVAILAYQEGLAQGMTETEALAYAGTSPVGGDIAHDVLKAAIKEAGQQVKDFATNSAAGQHAQALQDAVNDKDDVKDGTTFDNNNKKLDATLDQRKTPSAGDVRQILNE